MAKLPRMPRRPPSSLPLVFLLLLAVALTLALWPRERAAAPASTRTAQTPQDGFAGAPVLSQDPLRTPPPGGVARAAATPVPDPRLTRAAAGQPAVVALPALPGPPSSPFSRELARPDLPPAEAPKAVLRLFDAYRSRFGGYPSGGTNREFVNALTGNNPRAQALLDRSSPALNAKGELIDGWGTPYFFHLIASDYVEIRSAGPDRQMYTSDDVVAAPAR